MILEPVYEVGLKTVDDIAAIVSLVNEYSLTRLSIRHKDEGCNEIEIAQQLRMALPKTRITLHLSLRNLGDARLEDWLKKAQRCNPDELLAVSGNPRAKADVIVRWSELQEARIPLSCAHSCFESERLVAKLALPELQAIWLQITDDFDALKRTIETIRHLAPNIEVRGSLLLPNPSVRARLKFRMWHGVKLSQAYLDNQISAESQTEHLAELFRQSNVRPLVVALPFNSHLLQQAGRYLINT